MTRFSRRSVLAVLAASPLARSAWGQTYPVRPVRLVVPFSAGGQIDIVARLVGQWLSERLGQPVIIDNRPGASGNIAVEAVLHAPADGHTLLMAGGWNAVNATLFEKLNFDFVRDTAAIASIVRIPIVLEAAPSFPARTVPELIAYARSNPTKVNLATPPKGTAPYMSGVLFKMMSGVDLVQVPYRSEPQMVTDLIGGQIQVACGGIAASIEQIRANKLRALAVSTATRLDALPDLPTTGETLRGFEASGWCGLVAPRNTPNEVIDKLNEEINAGLADPELKSRFAGLLTPVLASSPAEFGRLIAEETRKWGSVIREANIRPD